MTKKAQFTLIDTFYYGLIQEQNIEPNEIDYYDKQALSSLFNLNSLTLQELSAITFNLIMQAKQTYNEMISMSDKDDDFSYWASDYENEQNTYLELKDSFEKFKIDLPTSLELTDHAVEFDNLLKQLKDI